MKNTFNASKTFFGGSALIVQYHDVLKPVYLTAIIKMLMNNDLQFGLPFDIIKSFSLLSLIEWYKGRSFINPIKLLDPKRKGTDEQLQQILSIVLKDHSVYKLTPFLDTIRLIIASEQNKLDVPLYIYSEQFEEGIDRDLYHLQMNCKYIHEPIKTLMEQTPPNATYIFSNIDLLKESLELIDPKKSANFILVSDYKYNFSSNQYKYNFSDILSKSFKPFIIINNISIFNNLRVMNDYMNLLNK